MMKTAVVFALLFCAAFAAPAEDVKAVEAAEDVPKEQVVAVADAVVEAPEAEELVAEVLSNSCPPGWLQRNSHCFLFVNKHMSWYRAEENCNSLGANLAAATSPTEYSFLQQVTQLEGQTNAWLGGFHLQDHWLWVGRQGMYYEYWYSKNSPYTTYPCVYLRYNSGWSNTRCTNTFPYICAKSLPSC